MSKRKIPEKKSFDILNNEKNIIVIISSSSYYYNVSRFRD